MMMYGQDYWVKKEFDYLKLAIIGSLVYDWNCLRTNSPQELLLKKKEKNYEKRGKKAKLLDECHGKHH